MAIKFKCPFCDRPLIVKDELAGKKGPCPGCKKVVTIPISNLISITRDEVKLNLTKDAVGLLPATPI